MCSGYSDMLPRFQFREEGFIPQAAGSTAYGKLFVVINNKQGLPWLKTTSSPNIHPHSMVTCPWTAPVTDPKVCRPDQNLPQGWLRPLLRLLSSSTSPSVQSCFFHFTSVPQVLISTALPTSLLYPSQLGVVISGNPIQQQGCRQGVLLSISYGPYHHHSPQGHKCT